MSLLTTASTHPSWHYLHGSTICSLDQGATSTFFRTQWPRLTIGLDNIPDTDLAQVLVSSLARVHEGLCSPYNTPDAVLPHRLWFQLILEVVASVHEGLRNVQLASPLATTNIAHSDAFDLLDGDKVALITKIYEILGWLTNFFQEDRDTYSDAEHLQSGYAAQSNDVAILSKSLQLINTIRPCLQGIPPQQGSTLNPSRCRHLVCSPTWPPY
jgi:hypothetical protein